MVEVLHNVGERWPLVSIRIPGLWKGIYVSMYRLWRMEDERVVVALGRACTDPAVRRAIEGIQYGGGGLQIHEVYRGLLSQPPDR